MLHSGNILTFIGVGLIMMPVMVISVLAYRKAYEEERYAKKCRKIHRRVQTHYERLQARTLMAAGSVENWTKR